MISPARRYLILAGLTVGALAARAPLAQVGCGDCNLDGRVNVLDALAASRHDVGIAVLTGQGLAQCDVNGSFAVTVLDALVIAQFDVGLAVLLACPDLPRAEVLEPEVGGMLLNELVLTSPQAIEVLNTSPTARDLSGYQLIKAGIDGIPAFWFTFPGAAGSLTSVALPGTPILISEDAGADTATHFFADSAIGWTNPILGGYAILLDPGFLPVDVVIAGTPLFAPPIFFTPPNPFGLQSIARTSDDDTDSGNDWASALTPTPEVLNAGQTGLGLSAGRFRGDVLLVDLLFDSASDPIDTLIEWTSDGGTTWSLATERPGFPSEGVTGLASSPGGIRHLWQWDSAADIGTVLVPAVRLRVTPSDASSPGFPDESAPFILDNANDAPVVAVDTPGPRPIVRMNEVFLGALDGVEILSFGPSAVDLSGWTMHTADITGTPTAWFTFPPGTQAQPGQPIRLTEDAGADTPTHFHVGVALNWTTFLGGRAWIANASGLILDLVEFGTVFGTPPVPWSGALATPTNFLARNNDGDTDSAADWIAPGSGTPAALNPGQTGSSPVVPLSTPLDVTYLLSDAQSDACALTVEFSTDGGASWQAASGAGGGDGTTGLASTPAGVGHLYRWDAGADLGLGTHLGLLLRLTASDLFAIGNPDVTGAFDLGLGDACPGVPVTIPSITSADTTGFADDYSAGCGGAGAPDQVFHVVANGEGDITASLCGAAFDTVLYVREGSCTGAEIVCNDDACGSASEVVWTPVCGQDYYIFVDGAGGAGGAYDLTLTQAAAPREQCPGEDITMTGSATGTTACGGITGISFTCPQSALSRDHIYRFTASLTGMLRASLCGGGTSYNSVLYIREGGCLGAELGCDDDACFPLGASELTVPCTSGETYTIFVDGSLGDAGDYILTISEF